MGSGHRAVHGHSPAAAASLVGVTLALCTTFTTSSPDKKHVKPAGIGVRQCNTKDKTVAKATGVSLYHTIWAFKFTVCQSSYLNMWLGRRVVNDVSFACLIKLDKYMRQDSPSRAWKL